MLQVEEATYVELLMLHSFRLHGEFKGENYSKAFLWNPLNVFNEDI